MKKEYILFDLDGTLTDPEEGITRSVQYALNHYGIQEEDRKKLIPFIGPPLRESFMKFYGFSWEQAGEAVWVYREYFTSRGIFENREIPGVRKMLKKLQAEGRKLYVATSKPEIYARQILEHFQLDKAFLFIGGADLEETRVKKADVIRYVLQEAGIPDSDKNRTVMVGDREHDVAGARENGISSVGVLVGYGSAQELKEAGADRIARDLEELSSMLLQDWGD